MRRRVSARVRIRARPGPAGRPYPDPVPPYVPHQAAPHAQYPSHACMRYVYIRWPIEAIRYAICICAMHVRRAGLPRRRRRRPRIPRTCTRACVPPVRACKRVHGSSCTCLQPQHTKAHITDLLRRVHWFGACHSYIHARSVTDQSCWLTLLLSRVHAEELPTYCMLARSSTWIQYT